MSDFIGFALCLTLAPRSARPCCDLYIQMSLKSQESPPQLSVQATDYWWMHSTPAQSASNSAQRMHEKREITKIISSFAELSRARECKKKHSRRKTTQFQVHYRLGAAPDCTLGCTTLLAGSRSLQPAEIESNKKRKMQLKEIYVQKNYQINDSN